MSKSDDKNYKAAKALVEECQKSGDIARLGKALIEDNAIGDRVNPLTYIVIKKILQTNVSNEEDFLNKVLKYIQEAPSTLPDTAGDNFIKFVEKERKEFKTSHTLYAFNVAANSINDDIEKENVDSLVKNLFSSITKLNKMQLPIKEVVLARLAEAVKTGDKKTQKFLGRVNDELLKIVTEEKNTPEGKKSKDSEKDEITKFRGDFLRTIAKDKEEKKQKEPVAPTVTPGAGVKPQIIHL